MELINRYRKYVCGAESCISYSHWIEKEFNSLEMEYKLVLEMILLYMPKEDFKKVIFKRRLEEINGNISCATDK